MLIPMQGDWKLSGLNLTTPLTQPDGTPTKYTYPEVDHRLPPQVQWKLDYLGEFVTPQSMYPSLPADAGLGDVDELTCICST
jgi:SCY1-like protein 2